MKTLIILSKDSQPKKAEWESMVQSRFITGICESQDDITSAIEHLESLGAESASYDFILCDYAGKGPAFLQALITAVPSVPLIVAFRKGNAVVNKVQSPNFIAQFETADPLQDIPKLLDSLIANGTLRQNFQKDIDFVSIKPETLVEDGQVLTDVYIRLAPDRYIKIFRSKEAASKEEFLEFREKKKVDKLYISKKEVEFFLEKDLGQLKNFDETQATPEQAEKVTSQALENLRHIVNKTGFSPQAAEVAQHSVVVALKVIGNSPSLAGILTHLKKGQGQYITDHSIALAQVACGMAYAVGWNSPSTYFKLTLASFLHDITLTDDRLAECRSVEEVLQAKRWEAPEISAFKMHTFSSAELVKQMHGIPPDVDSIIMQHHERPDGSGFPRKMSASSISPLAAVFIMAHDFVHYFLKHGENAKILEFYRAYEAEYNKGGAFRKIYKALMEIEQVSASNG